MQTCDVRAARHQVCPRRGRPEWSTPGEPEHAKAVLLARLQRLTDRCQTSSSMIPYGDDNEE